MSHDPSKDQQKTEQDGVSGLYRSSRGALPVDSFLQTSLGLV